MPRSAELRRRRVLTAIQRKPRTQAELAKKLGISVQSVTYDLEVLKDSGAIDSVRRTDLPGNPYEWHPAKAAVKVNDNPLEYLWMGKKPVLPENLVVTSTIYRRPW